MSLPETPVADDAPAVPPRPDAPFDAPWQARAFALAVAAHEAGLFDWKEWSAELGRALDGAAPDGSDYYQRWLLALERLLECRRPPGRP